MKENDWIIKEIDMKIVIDNPIRLFYKDVEVMKIFENGRVLAWFSKIPDFSIYNIHMVHTEVQNYNFAELTSHNIFL